MYKLLCIYKNISSNENCFCYLCAVLLRNLGDGCSFCDVLSCDLHKTLKCQDQLIVFTSLFLQVMDPRHISSHATLSLLSAVIFLCVLYILKRYWYPISAYEYGFGELLITVQIL